MRFFSDVGKDEMKLVCVTGENAEDGVRWGQVISCGNPQREQLKGKGMGKCEVSKGNQSSRIFPLLVH